MIKEYAFMRFTNGTLREAVRLWCTNRSVTQQRYGDINDWDVSRVTQMDRLFADTCCRSFNDDIDQWDVRRVTTMLAMFREVKGFNKPLSSWDTSNVITMSTMFYGASSFN